MLKISQYVTLKGKGLIKNKLKILWSMKCANRLVKEDNMKSIIKPNVGEKLNMSIYFVVFVLDFLLEVRIFFYYIKKKSMSLASCEGHILLWL